MEPIFTIPPDTRLNETADFLPLAGEANWGVEAFHVQRLRDVTDGKGVIVCVVDTGIDDTHTLLAPNFLEAKDFTGSASGYKDRNGHGSHCCGTVAATDPRIGMAPGAKLLAGKGLSDSGSGGGSGIAAAIRWAASKGADVISMSLGSSSEDRVITSAMQEVAAQGVWIVAAAGNSGPNTPDVDWPGRSPYAISVAALAADLSPASFSSGGAKIDTAFAGVNIWSVKPGGGYASMSGTSMATPGVAGVLALYRSALKLRSQRIPTVEELRTLLFNRSTDAHTPGDDRRTGPGWVTPILLALDIAPNPNPVG